uniref:Uncharacterized protein n=1 Tax=Lepeophtheirus salmonis TaxID=72036 RepID=A0A0K2UQ83_LEPSM
MFHFGKVLKTCYNNRHHS